MERFSVFSHLTSAKTDEYRRVLGVFAEARAGFVIHLRPAEVAEKLGIAEEAVDPVLAQLHEWGNLERGHDHVDAATVEEFYRVKWLYQLSARGEAAERALDVFENSLNQPGELQTEGLREIVAYLKSVSRLLGGAADTDIGKLHQQFRDLFGRFEEFTNQAQRFMRFLQGTIELHELTEADFLDYKDRLIDYLSRFVDELITSSAEIGGLLEELERHEVRETFAAVAKQARADALDADDAEAMDRERDRITGRWEGLRRWFLGDGTGLEKSQAETLRARAREAIPALLVTLQSVHDRRESGSDRRRDWMELARWFAEAENDKAAHRLWRVAFGLGPARHLRINEETLAAREQSNDGPRTSWLASEPMWLAPQLRKSGRAPRATRPAELVDLSRERDHLRRLAETENAQLLRAREQLATGERTALSDFAELDAAAFDLLMELLGRAVSTAAGARDAGYPVTAHSADGSLAIDLWPPGSEGATATVHCVKGSITGPDFLVTIRDASAESDDARSGAAA